jgi:hypothetical protein
MEVWKIIPSFLRYKRNYSFTKDNSPYTAAHCKRLMTMEFVGIAKNSRTNLKNVFPQAAHWRWQQNLGWLG